jgi:hypothetical protein
MSPSRTWLRVSLSSQNIGGVYLKTWFEVNSTSRIAWIRGLEIGLFPCHAPRGKRVVCDDEHGGGGFADAICCQRGKKLALAPSIGFGYHRLTQKHNPRLDLRRLRGTWTTIRSAMLPQSAIDPPLPPKNSSVAWIWAVVALWASETRTAPASDTMYFLISLTPARFRSTRHASTPPPSCRRYAAP